MKYTTMAMLVAAIVLLGATGAYAQGAGVAPWHATIAQGGAYDITYDVEGNELYTYSWLVTFHGIGTGADNERIRAFALYYLPDDVMPPEEVVSAGQVFNPVDSRNGKETVAWSTPNPNTPSHGQTISWKAENPTSDAATSDAIFVGEGIGWFQTTFRNPLPDQYLDPTTQIYSGVHVMWTDSDGRDQSEWVNQTPEPVSAVLLALGIPAALIARRRNAS